MRYRGGHLGATVSALLDGQLDRATAERAWAHVHGCDTCRRQVEREGWVKTQLAAMTDEQDPPQQLLGSLYGLGSPGPGADAGSSGPESSAHGAATAGAAWAAVGELERRARARRRAGLAVAGAGSVSVAVLGLASLTGGTLGAGAGLGHPPTSALTRGPVIGTPAVVAPLARVRGRLPLGGVTDAATSQGGAPPSGAAPNSAAPGRAGPDRTTQGPDRDPAQSSARDPAWSPAQGAAPGAGQGPVR